MKRDLLHIEYGQSIRMTHQHGARLHSASGYFRSSKIDRTRDIENIPISEHMGSFNRSSHLETDFGHVDGNSSEDQRQESVPIRRRSHKVAMLKFAIKAIEAKSRS